MIIDPLFLFVFFGLFSPGPNVILITASAARFGFRRTLPHVLGVAAGVGVTSGLTGYGIGALLLAQPVLTIVLKTLASLWILYMAWKLWNVRASQADPTSDQPFTFVQAVLFQWVNPKVWAVALSAMAYVATVDPISAATRLASAFSGINLFVCLFWSTAGVLLAYLLKNPIAWRIFMRTMAVLLGAFAPLVFLSA